MQISVFIEPDVVFILPSDPNPSADNIMKLHQLFIVTLVAGFALGARAATPAMPLELEVYNPGPHGIFPVSSEILSGSHEAVLIDAQFRRQDAEMLVRRLRAGGKTLRAVYVSHSDPDYYFGLDVIQDAFPGVKILATPQTVAAIRATMAGKLAYWGPVLKGDAPHRLVLPQPLQGDHLTLEGRRIEIRGVTGPAPERSYVWVPSLKTVMGGVVVSAGVHVWVADTQSAGSRRNWQRTLQEIVALNPVAVVPGHFLGTAPAGLAAVSFTADYLQRFETEAAQATDAAALIHAMQQQYPDLGEVPSLELSAKVIKGEMHWPQ